MPHTPQTPAPRKPGIYPAPDAWRAARAALHADTDTDLAYLMRTSQPTITRARLHTGDAVVGHEFVARAVYAFRDQFEHPFDFLFRVRVS